MSPREVAADLRERMESAKRAAENPDAGSPYALAYLLSACEAACARLEKLSNPTAVAGEVARSVPPEAPVGRLTAVGGEAWVSDAEAEAVADSLIGRPLSSHVSRAFGGGR